MTAFDRTSSETAPERPPWRGIVITALCLAAMLAVGWALWDRIPETVTTREAGGGRSGTQVPRLLVAAAFPAALAFIAAVMAVSVRAGTAAQSRLGIGSAPPARTRRWAMDALFSLLSPFLLLLHAATLANFAGYDVAFDRTVGVAVGGLLMGLGNMLPKIGPSRMPSDRGAAALASAWQQSQRAGGAVMMAVGAAAAVGALFLPPMPVAIAAALLVIAVYGLMFVLTLRRMT
ncbi:hypothetical protein [Streptomonospora salina]|uniref:DUF1648 domain-containing protein n=1 Tax=Streptomonospora salina TaxID=104205 RepID=A0A841EGJ2_9ACTN|nr:hypothetical protein [Streptomonospora salina]MBB6000479.1 hypothetical protein [Streptomonospora salina]